MPDSKWDDLRSVRIRYGGVFPHVMYDPTLCSSKFLIWDPVIQQPNIPVFCPFHDTELKCKETWQETKRRKPRVLYDLTGHVSLVGRYYQCDSIVQSHTIISTDEGILHQLREKGTIPFVLGHRTGFTLELYDYILHRYVNFLVKILVAKMTPISVKFRMIYCCHKLCMAWKCRGPNNIKPVK